MCSLCKSSTHVYRVCYHHYHNRKEGAKVRIEEEEEDEEGEDVQRILQQRKKDNLIGEI